MLQNNLSFGNYFICYLKRFILTYEIIHTIESTIKYYGKRFGNFFHTLAVTIYSTIITLKPTRGYGTTTIQGEN